MEGLCFDIAPGYFFVRKGLRDGNRPLTFEGTVGSAGIFSG